MSLSIKNKITMMRARALFKNKKTARMASSVKFNYLENIFDDIKNRSDEIFDDVKLLKDSLEKLNRMSEKILTVDRNIILWTEGIELGDRRKYKKPNFDLLTIPSISPDLNLHNNIKTVIAECLNPKRITLNRSPPKSAGGIDVDMICMKKFIVSLDEYGYNNNILERRELLKKIVRIIPDSDQRKFILSTPHPSNTEFNSFMKHVIDNNSLIDKRLVSKINKVITPINVMKSASHFTKMEKKIDVNTIGLITYMKLISQEYFDVYKGNENIKDIILRCKSNLNIYTDQELRILSILDFMYLNSIEVAEKVIKNRWLIRYLRDDINYNYKGKHKNSTLSLRKENTTILYCFKDEELTIKCKKSKRKHIESSANHFYTRTKNRYDFDNYTVDVEKYGHNKRKMLFLWGTKGSYKIGDYLMINRNYEHCRAVVEFCDNKYFKYDNDFTFHQSDDKLDLFYGLYKISSYTTFYRSYDFSEYTFKNEKDSNKLKWENMRKNEILRHFLQSTNAYIDDIGMYIKQDYLDRLKEDEKTQYKILSIIKSYMIKYKKNNGFFKNIENIDDIEDVDDYNEDTLSKFMETLKIKESDIASVDDDDEFEKAFEMASINPSSSENSDSSFNDIINLEEPEEDEVFEDKDDFYEESTAQRPPVIIERQFYESRYIQIPRLEKIITYIVKKANDIDVETNETEWLLFLVNLYQNNDSNFEQLKNIVYEKSDSLDYLVLKSITESLKEVDESDIPKFYQVIKSKYRRNEYNLSLGLVNLLEKFE